MKTVPCFFKASLDGPETCIRDEPSKGKCKILAQVEEVYRIPPMFDDAQEVASHMGSFYSSKAFAKPRFGHTFCCSSTAIDHCPLLLFELGILDSVPCWVGRVCDLDCVKGDQGVEGSSGERTKRRRGGTKGSRGEDHRGESAKWGDGPR